MSFYYSDDPVADFHNWDKNRERELEKLPCCSDCGEHIQGDYLYLINDEPICEDCILNYRKDVEDFIE